MAHAGQVIEGRDGFRLTLIETGAETGGEQWMVDAIGAIACDAPVDCGSRRTTT